MNLRILLMALAIFMVGPTTRKPAMADVPQHRVALVIGNAKYQYVPSLRNPANDARLIASQLYADGFDLIEGGAETDLTRAAMLAAIRKFAEKLGPDTVGIFYYAGHGLSVDGQNYLIPVDANPTSARDVDFELVGANLILQQMARAMNGLNVIILDACRNNPFNGGGMRALGGGLSAMKAPRGTLIAYSTQPDTVAPDGSGSDSPYSAALADALREPGLGVLDTFNRVGVRVSAATKDAEVPWVSASPIAGEFYFVAPSARTEPQVSMAAPPSYGQAAVSGATLVSQATALGQAGRYGDALDRFRQAASLGDTDGMRALGVMYQNGLGTSQDYTKAMRWYRLAADKGDPIAFFQIGWMYANGLGVARDYLQAMAWYQKGADHDCGQAIFQIGWMYQNGLGVQRDLKEALRWYHHGAALSDPESLHQIGWMYHNGLGVSQDYLEAMKWYRRAADQNFAASMYQIGTLYAKGLGVQTDYQQSLNYYRRASDAGYAPAMVGIGRLYHDGLGVPRDFTTAYGWFSRAAAKGSADAMLWLGLMCQKGEGVSRSSSAARQWFRSAMERTSDPIIREKANEALRAVVNP